MRIATEEGNGKHHVHKALRVSGLSKSFAFICHVKHKKWSKMEFYQSDIPIFCLSIRCFSRFQNRPTSHPVMMDFSKIPGEETQKMWKQWKDDFRNASGIGESFETDRNPWCGKSDRGRCEQSLQTLHVFFWQIQRWLLKGCFRGMLRLFVNGWQKLHAHIDSV